MVKTLEEILATQLAVQEAEEKRSRNRTAHEMRSTETKWQRVGGAVPDSMATTT